MHKLIKVAGNLINTEDITEIGVDTTSGIPIRMKDGVKFTISRKDSPEFFEWFEGIEDAMISFCPHCGGHNCDCDN